MDVSRRSTPPSPRLWQVLQLISQLAESRGSKNSIFPSLTLAGVAGLPSSSGAVAGTGWNIPTARASNASLVSVGEIASIETASVAEESASSGGAVQPASKPAKSSRQVRAGRTMAMSPPAASPCRPADR